MGITAIAKSVFFIVNTTAQDTSGFGVGSPDYLERYMTEHVQSIAATSDVVVIREEDSQDINARLQSAMESGNYSGVNGLYILSHGNGGFIPNRRVNEPDDPSAYHSNLYNEGGGFLINLTDKASVAQAFGSITARFNPDAQIIIDACETIADGSEEVKLRRMERVAEAFGLQDGALYMSDISNNAFTDLYIRTPFYASRSSYINNLASLLLQSTSAVSYPIGQTMEHFFRNSGYTMIRDGNQSELYADTLFHARTHDKPAGTPVAHRTQSASEN